MTENTRSEGDISQADEPVGHTGLAYMTGKSGPTRRDFLPPGTLPHPGPIGRIVRALLGLASLYFVVNAVIYNRVFFETVAPTQLGWYIAIAVGLWVVSPVVNIGLSRRWGYRPLVVVLALIGGAIALDVVFYGTLWAAPLGVVLLATIVPVHAYLGSSFILASILATPGCEMRAVPDAYGRVTGRAHIEHACPGPLHDLDVWEQRRRGEATNEIEAGSC